jgi:alpha-1,3-rhamnosyl/mannosyltransferase
VIRVGGNLLWLVPGEVGGSEEYTVRLLEAWAESRPSDLELTLMVNSSFFAVPDYAPLADQFPTMVAPTSGESRGRRVFTDATWVPRAANERGFDLLHHAGGTIPVGARGASLLTIHDLQPFEYPGNFSWAKRRYLRFMMPRSARQATRIATLTAFVATDVQRKLDVSADRFVRVPPGYRAFADATDAERSDVRARYQLRNGDGGPRPFFLYPAITYPHKNHVVLVHAFAEVQRRHPETALVLTGGPASEEGRVTSAVDRLGLGDAVRRTGRIPTRDLEVLYQEATALTFVSRYEGCGHPALEAMSVGCPVIASDSTGLVETVGSGGLLVGPRDVNGWAAAMERLLTDADERAELVRRGALDVARYDWAASAEALADAYRAVASAS